LAVKREAVYKEAVNLSEARKMVRKIRADLSLKREDEKIPITDAIGRKLAGDIIARRAGPARNFALMDGYAVRVEDEHPLRRLVGPVRTGDRAENIPPLEKGSACPISTGAFLPEGANAVLRLEDSRTEGNRLTGPALSRWMNVAREGSHYRKGTKLIRVGSTVRPQEIALLTEIGEKTVTVLKKLRVGVFSSGEEFARGIIPDTNSPMIISTLKNWGCEPVWLGVAKDKSKSIESLLKKGLKTCDAILSSGSISKGQNCYLPSIISRLGTIIFKQVSIKPGKLLMVAMVNKKPVFCLPGKPTGAFTALNLVIQAFFKPDMRYSVTRKKLAQTVLVNNSKYTYVVFLTFKGKKAYPLGYRLSGLKILESGLPYLPGIISSTPRAAVADGFMLTEKDLLQGETVEVNLLT
jgi:molybdenum cofactor synthesis domain-containing protein